MAAGKYKLKICQGSDQTFTLQMLTKRGLGKDLGASTVRMQIRSPDRTGTLVLDISETPTANGSVLERLSEVIIAPAAVTSFLTENKLVSTGFGFLVTEPDVQYSDTGQPRRPTLVNTEVARLGDLVRVAGSTSNDGDLVVKVVDDADTVETLQPIVAEAAAGTVSLIRYGLVELRIAAADSAAMDFETAEFDLEAVEAGLVTRKIQGRVVLDKEATR